MKTPFLAFFFASIFPLTAETTIFFANGIKVGEITPNSVVIWVRTTQEQVATNQKNEWTKEQPNWLVPGTPAKISSLFCRESDHQALLKLENQSKAHTSDENKIRKIEFPPTNAENNFCSQLKIDELEAATTYRLQIHAEANDSNARGFFSTTFTTAPLPSAQKPVTFTISTCQEFENRDELTKGHKIYSSMLKLNPDFFIQTGDTIYYDRKKPLSKTKDLARYRWNRMYALPYQREFHNRIPTYWMHDDHDLLVDDCEPGDTYGELTWQDGIDLWDENIPQSEKPYRTFRWGKDLQIWLPEVRYYRSPKKMKDGPEKSILGKEQWAWLEETMETSDATFKLYVSPTPVVGPDRKNKNDNHANKGFSHEGQRLRNLLSGIPGTFVINGDRHWQYHSIDPETGLQEFGAGPASDAHAQGWKKGDKRPIHQFLRVSGGFLSGEVDGQKLTLTHHDVDGKPTNQTVLTR